MAIFDRAIVRMLPAVPRPVVQKLSERYIAGPELKDARAAVRRINAQGKLATIDVLGEEITSEEDAAAIVRAYQDVFADIQRCGLDSNVSVKLSGLGLKLDLDLCRENLRIVVDDAARRGNFVRIDMEDSSTTDDTLRLYRELREDGFDNVGVVLQAMLRRTLDDIAALADLRPSVRLCKGIYVEPPELAFSDVRSGARTSYRALEALLDAGCVRRGSRPTTSGWSTRDAGSSRARPRVEDTSSRCCSGCVRAGRRARAEGHRVRIYVPFGRHWYAYSLRRLQENPKIAGYIAGDTLGRFLPGRNGALIWARAEGCRVWDAEGREYLDLSGGFGVAALGHRNPRVPSAISSAPVVHALGDLADAEVTAELRGRLPWPAKLGVTGKTRSRSPCGRPC